MARLKYLSCNGRGERTKQHMSFPSNTHTSTDKPLHMPKVVNTGYPTLNGPALMGLGLFRVGLKNTCCNTGSKITIRVRPCTGFRLPDPKPTFF